MSILTTPRLRLLPLSREMIEHRLHTDRFALDDQGPQGEWTVRFGPEWPGGALPMFPVWLRELMEQGRAEAEASFVAVDLASGEAVGQLGAKGQLSAAGDAEIGYGFNPACWGQGYATEAVGALVAFLREHPGVRRVVAWTAVANTASARVLENNGFVRVETGWDAEDGDLIRWAQGTG